MSAHIEITGLTKSFTPGRSALRGVSLSVAPGEMVALIGASGSGKSTLLRHISGLLMGDQVAGAGEIRLDGRVVQSGGRASRNIRQLRRDIGFIFQQFNLVGRLSVLTNVMCGRLGYMSDLRAVLGLFGGDARRDALEALRRVGIAACAYQRASTLSGGQQQRAAIARALMQRARVILADEPIASLDPRSSRRVMETLRDINRQDGTTVVVSLHQVDFALRYCGRVVALRDGEVRYDGAADAVTPALLQQIYGADSDLDFGLHDEVPDALPGRPALAATPA